MFRDAALRAKDISVNTGFVLESWVHELSLNVWIVAKAEMNIRKYRVDRYVAWYQVAYALLNVKGGQRMREPVRRLCAMLELNTSKNEILFSV